jgi:hypothetical protein
MAESAALLVDDVFPREPIRQWVDGVYAEDAYGRIRFHRIKAPTVDELGALVHRMSQCVAKFLERRGFLESDEENSYLTLETSDDEAMQQLYGHSINKLQRTIQSGTCFAIAKTCHFELPLSKALAFIWYHTQHEVHQYLQKTLST